MSITTFNRDIIENHILTRLDATTLVYTAATSKTMRALCTEEKLWKDICTATWPSINDPHVLHVISTFPSGYRSFFSDSSTFHRPNTLPPRHQNRSSPKSELISAIDIRYKNKIIFSKVQVTKDFISAPLSIEIPVCDETVSFKPNEIKYLLDLEKSMSLSWILIDPTRKRSINLSSCKPLLVVRNYTPDEVHLVYVTVLPGYTRAGSTDPAQCRILVTCEGEEGREMEVIGVKMEVQDMEGINLKGEDSLVILEDAIESERTKVGGGHEWNEFEFLERKKERREKFERRNKMLNLVCSIVKILIFVTLLCGVRIMLRFLFL